MAADQIELFMAAIRRLESGSYEGNYSAIGPNTGSTYGRARGAYQIMETIWSGWAAEAGIPGADWRSQDAQDYVARYKMNQYYEKYQDWSLVAVAWFAGPGRADAAKKNGLGSLSGINDVTGTSVPSYVGLIDKYMAEAPDEYKVDLGAADIGGDGTPITPYVAPVSDATAQIEAFLKAGMDQQQDQQKTDMRSNLVGVLDNLSNAIAGGNRRAMAAPVDIPLLGEGGVEQEEI